MAKVRKGDDYISIAKRLGIDASKLAEVNGYSKLNTGQDIRLPRITAVGEKGFEYIVDTPGPGMQVLPHEQSKALAKKGVLPGRGMQMGGYLNDDPYGGINPYSSSVDYGGFGTVDTTSTVDYSNIQVGGYTGQTTTPTPTTTYTPAPAPKPTYTDTIGSNLTGTAPTTFTSQGPTQTATTAPNTYYDNVLGVVSSGPTAPAPTTQDVLAGQMSGYYNAFANPTGGYSPFAGTPYAGSPTTQTQTATQPTTTTPTTTPTYRPPAGFADTRPGTGGGSSLSTFGSGWENYINNPLPWMNPDDWNQQAIQSAMEAPSIGEFFIGQMAGTDPFGYEWQDGILVSTGPKPIDARLPVALPFDMTDYIQQHTGMTDEEKRAWLEYIASLYHYDEYSDQWIINDSGMAGMEGPGDGGFGGGGGSGGGYGGYGGSGGNYKNYSNALRGLVNWRGVSFG